MDDKLAIISILLACLVLAGCPQQPKTQYITGAISNGTFPTAGCGGDTINSPGWTAVNLSDIDRSSTMVITMQASGASAWCCAWAGASYNLSNGTTSVEYSNYVTYPSAFDSGANAFNVTWNTTLSKWKISNGTTTLYVEENASINASGTCTSVLSNSPSGASGGGTISGTIFYDGELTVNYTTGGVATGSNNTFIPPKNLTINATPNVGWLFTNWTTNCNGAVNNTTNANTKILVNNVTSCYVQAGFLWNGANVTVRATPGCTANGSNSSFYPPANLTINATNTDNSTFTWLNWTTDCVGTIANVSNLNTKIQINSSSACYVQANCIAILDTHFSPGITGISFRPTHAYSQNVEPVNQTSLLPLYIVNNSKSITLQVVGKMTTALTGFSMKCTDSYMPSAALSMTENWTNLSVVVPYNPTPSTCYQETATTRGSCGATPFGSYSASADWNDGNWATNTTLNNLAVYVNYSVSTFASNATMQMKFGNATATNTSNVSALRCMNNSSTAQFRLQYYNQSLGNGSDGALVFTTTTKTYGNLVAGTDYNNSSNTLYLKLDRPYRFTNFTLGAGTTLSTQTANGTVLFISVNGTATINGTVNLTNVVATYNSSTISIDSISFSSTTVGNGGGGGSNTGSSGGSAYLGYGGGGAGGGGEDTMCGATGHPWAYGGNGGNANGSAGTGGAAVTVVNTGYSYGNNGNASAGGSGGIAQWNIATATSGKGGDAFGNNGSLYTSYTGGGCIGIGGSGGAGNIPGKRAPHFFMSTQTLSMGSAIFDVRGMPGQAGGNGSIGIGRYGYPSGGSGGGGGGGGDAGTVDIRYSTILANNITTYTSGGNGGAGGIEGGCHSDAGGCSNGNPGVAGTAGASATYIPYQLGSSVFCYYNSTWNSLLQIPQTQQMTYLSEEGIYWTLAAQDGLGELWCWADFNNPQPRKQSVNITINGVGVT